MHGWITLESINFNAIVRDMREVRDLLQIMNEIDPRTLYPVHTEHPEIYKRTAKNIIEVI